MADRRMDFPSHAAWLDFRSPEDDEAGDRRCFTFQAKDKTLRVYDQSIEAWHRLVKP